MQTQHTLSTQQIVYAGLKKEGMKAKPKDFHAAICNLLKQPNFRVLRADDSLLVINNQSNGVAEGIFLIADPKSKYLKTFNEFMVALKVSKFNKLKFKTKDKDLLEMVKKSKLQFSTSLSDDNKIAVELNF
jgi:hypothetical protein